MYSQRRHKISANIKTKPYEDVYSPEMRLHRGMTHIFKIFKNFDHDDYSKLFQLKPNKMQKMV